MLGLKKREKSARISSQIYVEIYAKDMHSVDLIKRVFPSPLARNELFALWERKRAKSDSGARHSTKEAFLLKAAAAAASARTTRNVNYFDSRGNLLSCV